MPDVRRRIFTDGSHISTLNGGIATDPILSTSKDDVVLVTGVLGVAKDLNVDGTVNVRACARWAVTSPRSSRRSTRPLLRVR